MHLLINAHVETQTSTSIEGLILIAANHSQISLTVSQSPKHRKGSGLICMLILSRCGRQTKSQCAKPTDAILYFFLVYCLSPHCSHPVCKKELLELPKWHEGGPPISMFPCPIPDPQRGWLYRVQWTMCRVFFETRGNLNFITEFYGATICHS